ncbi:NAD(P)(+) transhydrogenase (Re/Si-specific) subunit alpha, partial [Acidobacteriota bacterium]
MQIGVPKEISSGETRVAATPADVKKLIQKNHKVYVETGAGKNASFMDEIYTAVGAEVVTNPKELYGKSKIILKVQPPVFNENLKVHEKELLRKGAVYIGFLS